MASTVRIKTNGNTTLQGIELENFSTEETLAALLEQFKAFSAGFTTDRADAKNKTEKSTTKLEKLLAGLTGGAIGAEASGAGKVSDLVSKMIGPALKIFNPLANLVEDIGELTPEVLLAVAAFKLVSAGLSIFQGALNLVSRSITSLFSIAGNLVSTFASGKLAMSDYISAVQRGTDSLPIIGTFMSLLAQGAIVIEGWNQALIEMTKMGANFNGNISDMIVGAADAGLSVEDFSRIVKDNSESLATFGGIMSGVNTYTNVARISMRDYSDQLSGLGISFAQYSEELPRLLGLFGASMKAHGASDKELAQSAMDLTAHFDAMSQLTGKTRDQQAADLQKLTADAAWQQKLSTMTKDQSVGYLESLNEIQNTMGEGYAELYKFSVLGIPPLNKELQTLIAITPGLTGKFQEITKAIEGGLKGQALTSKLNGIVADMVSSGIKAGQNYKTVIAAAAAGLGGTAADIAKSQQALLAGKQEYYRNGQFDEQLFRQKLDQISQNREAQSKVSDNLIQFTNAMTELRDKIYIQVIGPLAEKIAPMVSQITKSLQAMPMQGIVDMLVGLVNDFGSWINTHKGDFKSDIEEFFRVIRAVISITLDVTKLVWGFVKFVADNWGWLKYIIGGLVLVLGATAGVGLIWAIKTAVGVLGNIGGFLASLGGASGAAEAGAIGVGGTAEVAEAGGLAALVGGEAATGIGLPLALATGAIGGGLLLWQHLSKKKKEQDHVEKQSYTQTSDVDSSVDNMQNISEILANHGRILNRIADNTEMSAKFTRKTASAVA